MATEARSIAIASDSDIVTVRHAGRALAEEIGFKGGDVVMIATAISELARNIVEYAKRGKILLSPINHGSLRGIKIVAQDDGPGIADVDLAMQDGYSTGRGLGLGLPGTRRLMDEFDIVSTVGKGTQVTLKKWLK